jgi:hypothetical protein
MTLEKDMHTIYGNGRSSGTLDHISFNEADGCFEITTWTVNGRLLHSMTTHKSEMLGLVHDLLPGPRVIFAEKVTIHPGSGDSHKLRAVANDLIGAFNWSSSSEGNDFWQDICSRLLAYADHLEVRRCTVTDSNGDELHADIRGDHIHLTLSDDYAALNVDQTEELIAVLTKQVEYIKGE